MQSYIDAIAKAFLPGEVHYAELIKVYGSGGPQPGSSPKSAESRYSPGRLLRIEKHYRLGMPFTKDVSTSFMERWNLTLRMQNRRFTRLTNGFSKKFENHCHMLALMITYYNFCRKHRALNGLTPAMAAGITDYRWSARDLLALDMWVAATKAA